MNNEISSPWSGSVVRAGLAIIAEAEAIVGRATDDDDDWADDDEDKYISGKFEGEDVAAVAVADAKTD